MSSSPRPSSEATAALFVAARNGEARAADLLFTHLYDELRRLSNAYVASEARDLTLSATSLVHEAYLRLLGTAGWSDRAHFLALAAQAMRRVLTDHARARKALKRGGGERAVTLSVELLDTHRSLAALDADEQVVAIDAALERLAARSPQLAQTVELRFFGGLEMDEVAHVLQVSPRTAARLWARAKAHLLADLATDV